MTQYLDAPVFDREAVLEMVDGEVEFVQELVQIFLEDLPTQLESLRASWANADADAVQQVGHGLEGSIGNLGAVELNARLAILNNKLDEAILTTRTSSSINAKSSCKLSKSN